MYRHKTRENLDFVSWVADATPKEIEDERLILNEELDDIAHQLKYYDGTDPYWYIRAVSAAKQKRQQLRLILKIAGDTERRYFDGKLKQEYHEYKQKSERLDRIERKSKRKDLQIQQQAKKIKRLKEALTNINPWLSASIKEDSCQEYIDACNLCFKALDHEKN